MIFVATVVGLLSLASGVITIHLIVSAFRDSIVQGLLSLLLPFYLAYWAVARFEHPQRRPMLWTFFGAPVLAAAIWGVWGFIMFSKMGS